MSTDFDEIDEREIATRASSRTENSLLCAHLAAIICSLPTRGCAFVCLPVSLLSLFSCRWIYSVPFDSKLTVERANEPGDGELLGSEGG